MGRVGGVVRGYLYIPTIYVYVHMLIYMLYICMCICLYTYYICVCAKVYIYKGLCYTNSPYLYKGMGVCLYMGRVYGGAIRPAAVHLV